MVEIRHFPQSTLHSDTMLPNEVLSATLVLSLPLAGGLVVTQLLYIPAAQNLLMLQTHITVKPL